LFDGPLRTTEELLRSEADVSCDLSEQGRRDVSPGMEWDCRSASIGVTILAVRASLANFREPQGLQKRRHLSGLQDGD
jgi:hypothetical protein